MRSSRFAENQMRIFAVRGKRGVMRWERKRRWSDWG
jgi:hypothetical protein